METNLNIRAYELLFRIETVLREILIEHCEQAFGPNWWKAAVLTQDARKRLAESIKIGAERRSKDDKKSWTSRKVFHPLYFVEFADLADAFKMRANAEKLDEICVANERSEVADQLSRLLPIRNSVAHMRMVSKADLIQVEAAHDVLAGVVGRSNFDRLAKTLPSQCAVQQEMDSIAKCFSMAMDSVHQMHAIDMTAWTQLSSRWWLDTDWHVDSESIRNGANLFASYQSEYQSDIVGRRVRMERWIRQHWKPGIVERSIASLQREKIDDRSHHT